VSSVTTSSVAVTILCAGLVAVRFACGQHAVSETQAKDRARIVLSRGLPRLDGAHLKLTLVEVRYDPGEASPAHSHPCAVTGDVVEGAIRSQVEGEPEAVYKAGESFYEAPNAVHLVSANASSTQPAKLIAYLICDHPTPLSVDVRGSVGPKGKSK
jgi:quercetin dioxygenase-like cupin family protein